MTNATFWVLTYSFNITLMRCCILRCCLLHCVGTHKHILLQQALLTPEPVTRTYNGAKSGTQINVEKEEKK